MNEQPAKTLSHSFQSQCSGFAFHLLYREVKEPHIDQSNIMEAMHCINAQLEHWIIEHYRMILWITLQFF